MQNNIKEDRQKGDEVKKKGREANKEDIKKKRSANKKKTQGIVCAEGPCALPAAPRVNKSQVRSPQATEPNTKTWGRGAAANKQSAPNAAGEKHKHDDIIGRTSLVPL